MALPVAHKADKGKVAYEQTQSAQNIDQIVFMPATGTSPEFMVASDRYRHDLLMVAEVPDAVGYVAPTTKQMLKMHYKSKYFVRLIEHEKPWVPVTLYTS